jgi:hypothetical protein
MESNFEQGYNDIVTFKSNWLLLLIMQTFQHPLLQAHIQMKCKHLLFGIHTMPYTLR